VFDSGSAAGRLWYTMPYVRGQSLRDLLRREVQVSLETALDITRQVGLALDYAHREGAVHRDIKPENILLSDGQALVADFGLARAIGAAAGEQLTETGIAMGTPAYMSPEQAQQASGSQVDARTDVYALGCVLYEMLAGEAPFTGPTPQAVIAKRFAQQPPSLRVVRPTLPATVDAAIQRALAPVPADRFSTVAHFCRALSEPDPPLATVSQVAPSVSRRFTWPRVRLLGMLALAGLGATAIGYVVLRTLGTGSATTLLSTGVLKQRERVIIADFQSRAPDSLLGPAATVAFRNDFAQSSVLSTVAPAQVADVLERMRYPASTRLDPALAREVAIRQGIKAVITGEVAAVGNAYLLSVQLVSPQSGEVLASQRETADDATEIIRAIDRLSKRLREQIGESLKSVRSEPPLEQVTTSSLEALWKYTQGLYAGDEEGNYAKAVLLLEEAVALDTGFATAWRTLGAFLWGLGERERALEAFGKALRQRDRLTDLERAHTLGIYYSGITVELDKAAATYRAAMERHPNDSVAPFNLGGVYMALGQPARAETLFRRAIARDPLDSKGPGPRVNLAWAQLALGKRRDAELALERVAQKFGDRGIVQWFGIMLASSGGDYKTAERRARSFKGREVETWNPGFPVRQLAALASAQGELAESERYRVKQWQPAPRKGAWRHTSRTPCRGLPRHVVPASAGAWTPDRGGRARPLPP
jgi:tetratricopeptide (TPR) repeat protein